MVVQDRCIMVDHRRLLSPTETENGDEQQQRA
jgi:hypothetical protein